MSKPQVINVPSGAGTGTIPPVQIPLTETSTVTLINLSNNLGLTLCNTTEFAPKTTWPLNGGNALPQPGINNLWVQNSNAVDVQVLVLEGIVPITNVAQPVLVVSPTPGNLPSGAQVVTASSGIFSPGQTAGTEIPGIVGKTAYITGVQISFYGLGSGDYIQMDITGLIGSNISIPLDSTTHVVNLEFPYPIPAIAPNSPISCYLGILFGSSVYTYGAVNIQGYYV